jgi:repressor LexA
LALKKPLTEKQQRILHYIEDQIIDKGHSPTVREIGTRFGISSTNGVRTHLAALIKKGYLQKEKLISRGLNITRSIANYARVPLVGSVPAGNPITAIENIESEIAVDTSFLPKGAETFTLRVSGNSMKDAGILDGDLVMVRKQQTAQKGDIVVAIVNGEATVKRYMPTDNKILLLPENEEFDPIVVARKSGEFSIAGKVVGLLRKLD